MQTTCYYRCCRLSVYRKIRLPVPISSSSHLGLLHDLLLYIGDCVIDECTQPIRCVPAGLRIQGNHAVVEQLDIAGNTTAVHTLPIFFEQKAWSAAGTSAVGRRTKCFRVSTDGSAAILWWRNEEPG